MCLPIAKYKKIIQSLEIEIYPSLIKRLDGILFNFQQVQEHQSPNQLKKLQLTIDLKTELYSLQSYETQLIFPSVLSMILNDSSVAKINLNQVLQLTNFKENKIERYSYELQQISGCKKAIRQSTNQLTDVIDAFLEDLQTKLLPIKRQWSFMLASLSNASLSLIEPCGTSLLKTHCSGICNRKY